MGQGDTDQRFAGGCREQEAASCKDFPERGERSERVVAVAGRERDRYVKVEQGAARWLAERRREEAGGQANSAWQVHRRGQLGTCP